MTVGRQHAAKPETPLMVPEIIRYEISAEHAAEFEAAYRAAGEVLRAAPECLGFELLRSERQPENYLLTIHWISAEAHLAGFRRSPRFQEFLTHVRPFVPNILEMEHYRPTGCAWNRNVPA
jgi:quinol monooxygenase YgiN